MNHHFVELVLFFGGFFLCAALLQEITKRLKFPYTVALLLFGLGTQFLFDQLHLEIHPELPADVIFFVLLPALLFGAAMHINFHQFRLQFKTISFLATMGLLVSMLVVSVVLPLMIGIPFEAALLFGALISATDPIAVLALFNTLGAPKRLALLADGESMFNDATGVIAFRVISTVVLAGGAFTQEKLTHAVTDFLYIFVGSIILGVIVGYVLSKIIATIKNDIPVETTLTLGIALLSFAGAEHFFHLSGVISSVMAGLVMGNLGRSKFSPNVNAFIREFWDYVGFAAVSLVFFFATFNLEVEMFFHEPSRWLLVTLSVLIARAVSIYAGFAVTNSLSFFKDEPNVPLSWQHILNWGGLRGVIPLVLVFTIPDSYEYKSDLLVFTLGTLLFTLFVNGLTIEFLLKTLGLHLPRKEEEIEHEEQCIFEIEESLAKLEALPRDEFSQLQLKRMKDKLLKKEGEHKVKLLQLADESDLETSLRLQLLKLERLETEKLFKQGYINENVMYEFDAQLDMQQDALEYPEVFSGRGVKAGGLLSTERPFRTQIYNLRRAIKKYPFLGGLLGVTEERIIQERYSLLKARLITAEIAQTYLDKVKRLLPKKDEQIVEKVQKTYQGYEQKNRTELKTMENKYGSVVKEYQNYLLEKMVIPAVETVASH